MRPFCTDGFWRSTHLEPHATDRTRIDEQHISKWIDYLDAIPSSADQGDTRDHPTTNRALQGQTSAQLLCRFTGLPVYAGGEVVTVDPDRLAEIDQSVFSGLDQAVGVQLVKVPVSAAVWSTWRRYCETRGQAMGERIAGLIVTELETVVDGKGTTAAELADHIAEGVEERSGRLDARERELRARSDRLRRREDQLTDWERELGARERAVTDAQKSVKVGRNERCPCGSGLKYKHCHGGPLRSET